MLELQQSMNSIESCVLVGRWEIVHTHTQTTSFLISFSEKDKIRERNNTAGSNLFWRCLLPARADPKLSLKR